LAAIKLSSGRGSVLTVWLVRPSFDATVSRWLKASKVAHVLPKEYRFTFGHIRAIEREPRARYC